MTLSSAHLYSGDAATGRVELSCAPSFRSVRVTLDVEPDGALTVPEELTVPRGQTTAEFIAVARPAADRTAVTLRAARAGGSASTSVTVDPGLRIFSAEPWQVGGRSVGVTFHLTGTAPPEGLAIAMRSDNPAVRVPSVIEFPAGATGLTTTVPSDEVPADTPVTLTATLGQTSLSSTVTLAPR
ncbi:MAG: hypothetical protein GEV11_30185, partial [Streptosporangiales bacterium]|nr:hypothetical protein [Streptosporangiales bacterium]